MEVPNKKTMVSIFAGCVFLQMVFILAFSANFLLAQTYDSTNPDSELQIWFDSTPPSSIYGENTISAATNIEPDYVEFKITGPENLTFTGIKDSPTNYRYYFVWDTINSPDGNYYVEAMARKEGMYEAYASFSVNVDNSNNNSNDTSNPTVEISVIENGDRKNFSAASNAPLENVMFHFDNLSDSAYSLQFSGTLSDTTNLTNWSLSLNDGDLMSGIDYNFYAMGSYEGTRYKSTNNILIPVNSENDATTDPLILTFIERFESPLFGDRQISISSTQEIYSCIFKIYGSRYAEFPAIKDSPTKYHIILRTKDFPDGSYTIKAVAGNNIGTAEVRLDIRIENQTETEFDRSPIIEPVPIDPFYPTDPTPIDFSDQPTPDSSTEPYYPKPIPYQPEQPTIEITPECLEKGLSAEECLRYNQLPPECVNQGIINQEECDQIISAQFRLTFECKNANITNVEECDRYMMNNFMPEECREANAATKEECDYILRNKYSDYEGLIVRIEAPFMENDVIRSIERELPPECLNNGINSFEECEKYMISANMPEECREANAATAEECDQIMFRKYGPKECLEAGILNPEACEKHMFEKFAPDDCKDAGILNPEACKKYMFEKYNGAENIPQEKFPIECQKANAKTADECDKIMRNIYLPKECKEQGINDEEKCDLYLRQKHMPEECRKANALSRSECNKIMFKKFGPPECQEAGIEDEEECQEFMFNKYAPQVECGGLEKWQCNNFIRDRHLGNIVAKQTVFSKLKENVAYLAGETVTSKELKERIGESANIIPVKEEVKFKIVLGKEKLTLNEEDNLIQTAPIILMIDNDMDGLPDDLEKRLGTDPTKMDTDGDGYSDGEEVKNGRNPLGEGELESKISLVDEAILQNKTLGHPKTEGEETENIAIENIANLENKQTGAMEGYALSGKSEPNSVVALYIYSDLPLVITTKTDEYGNWRYELSEPLTEGEHEIYVAINDNTGKVVSKSKPLNFFVKEAQAVSVKDFFSPTASAASEAEKESESSIYYYLIAALSLIIIGILFFVAMIIRKKRVAN